ncbi:MAG: transcription elongation factor GreA [Candidatus Levybacteria bacterium]|nr:transcription elongation factor GreA [Candidatus Levybacteria bacterium]
MDTIRFTKEGHKKLVQEMEDLKVERPGVIADVQKARELGDLKENGYYQASKAKLRQIDSRLMHIKYYLKVGEIVADTKNGAVTIGSVVTMANGDKEMTYAFVGDLEADPSQKKLSLLSPIGRAVEGKVVGETFAVDLPAGKVTYTVKKVS